MKLKLWITFITVLAGLTINTTQTSVSAATRSTESVAKSFIAQHESSNNYNANNGLYYGKYQLQKTLLRGDYSPRNQERVAKQYVVTRYGSWSNAKQHWVNYGWY